MTLRAGELLTRPESSARFVTCTVVSVMPYILTSSGESSGRSAYQSVQALERKRFPAENNHPEEQAPGIGCAEQLIKRGRRSVEHRHPFRGQQAQEIRRRPGNVLRSDDKTPAVEQRSPDLPDREVEGEGVEHHPHIVRTEPERVLRGAQQAHDITDAGLPRPFGLPVEPEV